MVRPLSDFVRWSAEVCTDSPKIAPGIRPTSGGRTSVGGLEINRMQRGLCIRENDTQRSVNLSAAEAGDLLAFLREHEELLQQMADEDTQVVDQSRWRDGGGTVPPPGA